MTVTYDPAQALEQVAAGLKRVALDPIPTVNGFDYPLSAPPLTAGIVQPPAIDYRVAMRVGVVQLDFEIWLLEGTSAGWEQQKNLWRYLTWAGPYSILALIDANPSLGIIGVDGTPRVDAHVMSNRPLGLEETASLETSAFGTALIVTVHVTNKE